MARIPVKIALLRQLLCDDIRVIFGNPGTVEESLLDALTDVPEIRYVTGLQESVVVAMADGFARVSRRPAVAQVHAAVGLGNSMAMLYQAHRSHTPLVVLAGETYSEHHAFDGFLGGDLVRIAEPVTKYAARVTHGSQAIRLLRRALKVAATPPQGPVFLALPMDVLDEEVEFDETASSFVDSRTIPSQDAANEVAEALLESRDPLFLVGDGVALAGAQAELKALSELIGAPVFGVDFADLSASFRDPLFMGLVGHSFGENTRRITLEADVVLAVGTPIFPELFPSSDPYFRDGARVFHVDLDAWEIAKNFPVARGIQADPRLALEAVRRAVEEGLGAAARDRAKARIGAWTARKEEARLDRERRYAKAASEVPMAPSKMMEVIVDGLPDNVLVYDESITSTDELLHYLQPHDPTSYFLGRGGCIGVGWPGAVGAAVGADERAVLALSGDGSALFVVQVLWTAAQQKLPIVFVVCNNRSYRILKVNLLHYWADNEASARDFPHFDLDNPPIDFTKIAEGFGVTGRSVQTPDQLTLALKEAFSERRPFLIDVLIDGAVTEETRRILRAHSGCS